MNRVISAVLLFVAIFLIILGAIFVIAGGLENMIAGGIMVVIAIVLIFFSWQSEKVRASQPKLINQTFNVKMEGSGQLEQKQLKCNSCGAPLSEKNLTVVSGGIMVSCPYCGTRYALEEAPKW
jgi:DNA-directed RNA polymerase subunit RPC12/RpoP